jgi:hypothetical protein
MSFSLAASSATILESRTCKVEIEKGVVSRITDPAGQSHIAPVSETAGAKLHFQDGDRVPSQAAREGDAWMLSGFADTPEARIVQRHVADPDSGDIIITQEAKGGRKGLTGVSWSISGIPLDMNILVPGSSGLKLTRTTPGAPYTFDYPISWEAQMLIVEGAGRGFYLWAEDAEGIYKKLVVDRKPDGWSIRLTTHPYAPYEEASECKPLRWHLNVYEGDWRVPAKRYRDWAEHVFQPTPVAAQKPAWVKDIRCCAIMNCDEAMLAKLAERVDTKQTLLYLYDWRKAGYDRDYPSYDAPFPHIAPFIEKAHALGFKVMLHVNYFGCDPLNPLYAQFEKYQIRNPVTGQLEWWTWDRADPPIKFAYINPAYKPWRDLLVERFTALRDLLHPDALHLDQTLCIYNDKQGLIDGMSLIQGNIALHRELREALPDVALSGEGLDEITYRHEAFAQRHVFGMNHAEGNFDLTSLQMAHPISSYLLRNYTTIYGYLGMTPPTRGQLYGAWREAYRNWGVIPTITVAGEGVFDPANGFCRQLQKEMALWCTQRVNPDMDAAWPPEVAFPWIGKDNERVSETSDRRVMWRNREITRTVVGVSQLDDGGTVPGWAACDDKNVFGLDPGRFYPVSNEPVRVTGLRVTAPLPEGVTMGPVLNAAGFSYLRFVPGSNSTLSLAPILAQAVTGARYFGGEPTHEQTGELNTPDGAMFMQYGPDLQSHPPYNKVKDSGVSFARYSLDIPADATLFCANVALGEGTQGHSDGVLFSVEISDAAKGGMPPAAASVVNKTATPGPLTLDLKPWAGKKVILELSTSSGEAHNPTYDWARWYWPRIERGAEHRMRIAIEGAPLKGFCISGAGAAPYESVNKRFECDARLPGAVFILSDSPEPVELPVALETLKWNTSFASDEGLLLADPLYACAVPGERTCGGVTRKGLYAHPPAQGRTMADFPIHLPDAPARLDTWIGIHDNDRSAGVLFRVEVNGIALDEHHILPGSWMHCTPDLTAWAGQDIVLSLITDAEGSFDSDWALWGEPVIRAK